MVVLLTGATGFVGRNLYPALAAAGHRVRCLSRDPRRARERWPEREWVPGDAGDEEAMTQALAGCDAAYYLVHGMAENAAEFRRLERETAARFARAAARAGLKRIVYLGGFKPQGTPTEHLQSRLEVGEVLRAGPVPAIELRASMIVGPGSLSWLIVRDLAARLPAMILPRWLRSRTQPIWIGDAVAALEKALELPLEESAWFDLPGPQALTGREILLATARLMGLPAPWMIQVPVLSPWLSSHWVRFVTRAEWSVAREVVVGMAHDFLAQDDRFWKLAGISPVPFEEAARRTLAAEEAPPAGFWGAVERRLARRARRRGAAS
jgi:uncharacterized protein YbjT (DUF2867 family)